MSYYIGWDGREYPHPDPDSLESGPAEEEVEAAPDSEEEGQFLVIAPRSHWVRQVKTALDAWQTSGVRTLDDFADVNYQQFCLLIEAWYALGQRVSPELLERAQMG